MGQYHLPVNLDKHEYLHPHRLGDGLKLLEFGMSGFGTMAALTALLDTSQAEHGRWAGDRIAIVGDYAEAGDMAEEFHAESIYSRCGSTEDVRSQLDHLRSLVKKGLDYSDAVTEYELALSLPLFTDVSEPAAELLKATGRVAIAKQEWGGTGHTSLDEIGSWEPGTGPSLVILNETLNAFIDPAAFGDTPTFDRFAFAFGGSALCALAVLLACASGGGGRGGGDIHFDQENIVGSWAASRISVVPSHQAHGIDISAVMRQFLVDAERVEFDVIDGAVIRRGWGGQS